MNTIGVVDFSYFLRVNYHARAADSGPNECGQHTLNQLSDWRREHDHLIVALDSPPYWRKQVHDLYKASRERDDTYIQICRWTKDRLVADGYSIAACPTFEADDIIATLAVLLKDRAKEVRLITADHDALQCVTGYETGVRVYAPKGRGEWEIRDTSWVKERYGVMPGQMPLLQSIKGDKDEVPGIKGIGEKGAAKLINDYASIAGMRVAAVRALDAAKAEGGKPLSAGWARFLEGSPKLPDYLQLATLRTDVPLDVEALLVKQPMRKLVEDSMADPEDDGRDGDGWHAELAEEAELMTGKLDPAEVISGPKASTPSNTSGKDSRKNSAESSREVTDASASSSVQSSAIQPSGTPAQTHSTRPLPAAEKPAEVVTGEIVVARQEPWALQLQPRSASDAMHIAKALFNSRLYSQFGSERGIFAIIMLGRELGLGVSQSLQGFFSVKDRPFASSAILRALVQRHPDCEYFVCTQSDENSATFETRRRSWPQGMKSSYTYTWQRAMDAGLTTGSNAANWKTKRVEMIEKTAAAKLARRDYSDVTFGLHTESEID